MEVCINKWGVTSQIFSLVMFKRKQENRDLRGNKNKIFSTEH